MILAHEHQEPLDYIVFSEVMFDKERGISGENDKHMQFVLETAKPLFESWGYKVLILHSDVDYLGFFNRVIERPKIHMEHKGKRFGFPAAGKCGVKRDCKMRPIENFISSLQEPVIEYVGIAADETERLCSMHKDPQKVSLLEKHGYSESMAMRKCQAYGLVSPGYRLSKRGGCWFCPYAKEKEHLAVFEQHPDVWKQFVQLESEENLAHDRWNVYGLTLKERDSIVRNMSQYEQICLMD